MGKNNKLLTNSEVDFILKKYNYKRLEEYTNNRTKFTCENIKTKYRYSIKIDSININKPTLWGLSNEVNFEYNIKLWLKNNTNEISYLKYEKITKNKTKRTLVYLKCSCGNEFVVDLTKMVNGYYKVICCDDCKLEKYKIYGVKKTTKKHLEIIKKNNYSIIDEEYYKDKTINCSTLVDVIDKDGYKGSVSSNLCNKSKTFTKFSPNINKKFYIYNINLFYNKNNIECKCIGSKNGKILLKCKCGNEFLLECKYIKYSYMCSKCNDKESMLEKRVSEYLKSKNIDFKREYRFKDCKDKIPLPFDFYLPKLNICIETDGKQHYEVVNCFGGEEDFNKRKLHDEIKNEYCHKKNIKLIRIPYYEFNNDNWKIYLEEIVG